MCTGMDGYDVFFFNDTATTEIYTLSLHDALPILIQGTSGNDNLAGTGDADTINALGGNDEVHAGGGNDEDRKSTRLNSSHANISYAVFCLKKKNHHVPLAPPGVRLRVASSIPLHS